VTTTSSVGWPSAFARENVIFTGVQLSKDDTPGCTKEACNFRDANHLMQKRGIVVLGVSADTTVSQIYDVYKEKNMYGKKYMGINRETFLIDKDGIVRKAWHKVKPEEHANEVLETVDALNL
jgi:peroxiredoxin Q/BCP